MDKSNKQTRKPYNINNIPPSLLDQQSCEDGVNCKGIQNNKYKLNGQVIKIWCTFKHYPFNKCPQNLYCKVKQCQWSHDNDNEKKLIQTKKITKIVQQIKSKPLINEEQFSLIQSKSSQGKSNQRRLIQQNIQKTRKKDEQKKMLQAKQKKQQQQRKIVQQQQKKRQIEKLNEKRSQQIREKEEQMRRQNDSKRKKALQEINNKKQKQQQKQKQLLKQKQRRNNEQKLKNSNQKLKNSNQKLKNSNQKLKNSNQRQRNYFTTKVEYKQYKIQCYGHHIYKHYCVQIDNLKNIIKNKISTSNNLLDVNSFISNPDLMKLIQTINSINQTFKQFISPQHISQQQPLQNQFINSTIKNQNYLHFKQNQYQPNQLYTSYIDFQLKQNSNISTTHSITNYSPENYYNSNSPNSYHSSNSNLQKLSLSNNSSINLQNQFIHKSQGQINSNHFFNNNNSSINSILNHPSCTNFMNSINNPITINNSSINRTNPVNLPRLTHENNSVNGANLINKTNSTSNGTNPTISVINTSDIQYQLKLKKISNYNRQNIRQNKTCNRRQQTLSKKQSINIPNLTDRQRERKDPQFQKRLFQTFIKFIHQNKQTIDLKFQVIKKQFRISQKYYKPNDQKNCYLYSVDVLQQSCFQKLSNTITNYSYVSRRQFGGNRKNMRMNKQNNMTSLVHKKKNWRAFKGPQRTIKRFFQHLFEYIQSYFKPIQNKQFSYLLRFYEQIQISKDKKPELIRSISSIKQGVEWPIYVGGLRNISIRFFMRILRLFLLNEEYIATNINRNRQLIISKLKQKRQQLENIFRKTIQAQQSHDDQILSCMSKDDDLFLIQKQAERKENSQMMIRTNHLIDQLLLKQKKTFLTEQSMRQFLQLKVHSEVFSDYDIKHPTQFNFKYHLSCQLFLHLSIISAYPIKLLLNLTIEGIKSSNADILCLQQINDIKKYLYENLCQQNQLYYMPHYQDVEEHQTLILSKFPVRFFTIKIQPNLVENYLFTQRKIACCEFEIQTYQNPQQIYDNLQMQQWLQNQSQKILKQSPNSLNLSEQNQILHELKRKMFQNKQKARLMKEKNNKLPKLVLIMSIHLKCTENDNTENFQRSIKQRYCQLEDLQRFFQMNENNFQVNGVKKKYDIIILAGDWNISDQPIICPQGYKPKTPINHNELITYKKNSKQPGYYDLQAQLYPQTKKRLTTHLYKGIKGQQGKFKIGGSRLDRILFRTHSSLKINQIIKKLSQLSLVGDYSVKQNQNVNNTNYDSVTKSASDHFGLYMEIPFQI